MITQGQVDAYKADVNVNVNLKTEKRSIKKEKIGNFYKTLADWFLDIQGQIVGVINIYYSDLQSDHKTYINADLIDKPFVIFQNSSSRFLNDDEYSINVNGGFILVNELISGDRIILFGGGITSSGGDVILYNALDRVDPGAALDARQGKVLYDLINASLKRKLTFNQSDLLDTAGDENWYLPIGIVSEEGFFVLAEDTILECNLNNNSIEIMRDNNFTPNRLYGFANNLNQSIVLTVI